MCGGAALLFVAPFAGSSVVAALLEAHPYEEPAYDVVELAGDAPPSGRGHGRIGRLAEPTTLRGFAELVRDAPRDGRLADAGQATEDRQQRRHASGADDSSQDTKPV